MLTRAYVMMATASKQLWVGFALLTMGLSPMLGGCGPETGSGRFDATEVPGGKTWGTEEVGCQTSDDCGEGEVCEEGLCQMQRCNEAYSSQAPLGTFRYFGVNAELIVASDDHYVDGVELGSSYLGSLDLTGEGTIRDIAGGNLNGQRPQGVAIAMEGSHAVLLDQSDGLSALDVGFVVSDVATGDVDADSLDELVALSTGGELAVCDVEKKTCSTASISGISGRDVTVGDVDGDGYGEVVVLYNVGDEERVLVWNLDADITGQESSIAWTLDFDAKEVDAGDPYGRGYDVVVIKHERGWNGLKDDRVQIFDIVQEQIIASHDIHGHTIDVAVGDRDGDGRDEIVTLIDDHRFQVHEAKSDGGFQQIATHDISVGSSSKRIAMVDFDGDSPAGRLLAGPELVAGDTVPVTVLTLPPYPRDASAGVLSAKVGMGNTESTDETVSDTVALSLGIAATFGAEAGPFKASVTTSLEKSVSTTHSVSASMRIGERFHLDAQPDVFGDDYAGVVIACGCYHRYRYETDDPAGKLGGSGQVAEIYVPVGGQTQLWSSHRYNALAEALGTLPIIDVKTRVGDPDSYPTQPVTFAGEPVAQTDMLFPNPASHQMSDVGYVGFWLAASEQETNSVAETTTLGTSASFGVFGSGVEVSGSVGVTSGYSVSVGNEAMFYGQVPPVPDDPNTPEDEFQKHRFSFTPYVYREHYENAAGEAGGYYVVAYARGE